MQSGRTREWNLIEPQQIFNKFANADKKNNENVKNVTPDATRS